MENYPTVIRNSDSSAQFWSKYRPAIVTEIIRRGEYNNNDNYNINNKFFYVQYTWCTREIKFQVHSTIGSVAATLSPRKDTWRPLIRLGNNVS